MKALWLILAVFSLSSLVGPSPGYAGGAPQAQLAADGCDHGAPSGAAPCCDDPEMSAACAQACNAIFFDAPFRIAAASDGQVLRAFDELVPDRTADGPPAPPPRLSVP